MLSLFITTFCVRKNYSFMEHILLVIKTVFLSRAVSQARNESVNPSGWGGLKQAVEQLTLGERGGHARYGAGTLEVEEGRRQKVGQLMVAE